jgi:hypothetical protein
MSAPKFLFSARPSKHVERVMIIDACRRLEKIAPLADFHYIGFGGLEFVDFDLVHRHLGIKRMTSIERDLEAATRYEFNKPYREVELRFGESRDELPVLDWSGLCIVWLDYFGHLSQSELDDCEMVVREMQPGSVLIVTLKAEADIGTRAETFRDNVGVERVPDHFRDEAAFQGEWAFADAQYAVLVERLNHTANLRTPPVILRQFLNFHYRDSKRMQTIAWIVSSPALEQSITQSGIDSLEVSRPGPEAKLLKLPILTRREVLHLNGKLPLEPGENLGETWLAEATQAEYADLYRWYPTPV